MLRHFRLGLIAPLLSILMVTVYGFLPITVVFAEGEETPPAIVETPPVVESPPIVVEETPPVDPLPAEIPPAEVPAPIETTVVPPVAPGPSSPVGPSADTYTFNGATGLWENSHYTWDPITKQTKPKEASNYSYNPSTGRWDTTEWVYVPETGNYQKNIVSYPAPELTEQQEQLIESLPDVQGALLRALLLPSAQQGPGADSSISNSSSNNGFFDLFHNASISNRLDSKATTGDAIVANNTLGGNATSGDAQAVANLFNVLNSSIGFLGSGSPLFFTANLLGNILGDLFIDPGQLPTTPSQQYTDSNLQVQAQNTGTINNDINLLASSGAATVANNTQAGNATSGNAYALANIFNAINSSIGSGQSFMGMINIYGNLNGDILLPPGFINSLLASNAQAPATSVAVTDPYNTDISNTTSQNTNLTVNDTSNIANNLAVTAASGATLVGSNTAAGSATSGDAQTNVTLLNLTGKQIVAKNALLVFVNVLGNWLGLIMNAPTGVTAGVLGDASASALNSTTDIVTTTTNAINNNINVSAQTGDATVANNTTAGNAISGNAHAAVNVLNMSNSSLALSDWFGVLFINVLGNWYGSFGVDTDAGNPIDTPSVAPFIGTSTNGSSPQTFSFVPATSSNAGSAGVTDDQITAVLAETSTNDSGGSTQVLAISSDNTNSGMSVPWLALALALILLILFGDRLRGLFAARRVA